MVNEQLRRELVGMRDEDRRVRQKLSTTTAGGKNGWPAKAGEIRLNGQSAGELMINPDYAQNGSR